MLLKYMLVSSLQEEDEIPIEATLVEGGNVAYDVALVYSHGEGKFLLPYITSIYLT
jgi:hypothetical protein